MNPLSSTTYESPIGLITLVASDRGLCGLFNEGQKHWPEDSDAWSRSDNPVFVPARKWLDGYFRGKNPRNRPEIAFTKGTEFQKKVWTELLAIPPGKTISYGELARRIGKPEAVRAVGAAVGRNPISIIVPCHRVLGAGGKLTGYAGGLERKKWLLAFEAGARPITSPSLQPT